jgi:hypothetical protein
MKPRLTTLLVALWQVLLSDNSIAAQAPASPNAIGTQAALGTNFVYQGFLNSNGQPANGQFDFEFTLYEALSGGNQVGNPSSATNQTVTNGLFTVMIDFGAGAFNGSARFMQIRVRPSGTGEFVALNPRIELAAVPNAQFSSSAGGLQGRPVSGAAPAPNQVLQWDGAQWAPANAGNTAYTAGNGLTLAGQQFSIAVPLNLAGAAGPILAVSNTGVGRAGAFTNLDPNYPAISGTNTGTDGLGVYGIANNGINAAGVEGDSARGFPVIGFQGTGVTVFYSAGVVGASGLGNGTGIYGIANSGQNSYGVWGESSNGFAGYFSGRVHATGGISSGAAAFVSEIDHPLDPTNKYLRHSVVESPDMKNIYDGVVTLDANGAAVVELPAYFQALNQDFRYQLTCIGGFAQIYIDKEIANNSFSIAGGKPGLKVSWQVTGIRHDPGAELNRPVVEENKPAEQRGTYLQPSAYGQPETLGADYARKHQATLKQSTQLEGR